MRLGIFGGTFDPPHIGHLIIGEFAVGALGLDKLLIVPNSEPLLKNTSEHSSPEHRAAMTRLAIAHNPKFEFSDIEIARTGASYTIDTIREIKRRMNPEALFVIIGADNLDLFPKWHEIGAVLNESRVVVCDRLGGHSHIPQDILQRVQILDSPIVEISSTSIRERIRRGESIRYFVPNEVGTYITNNHLYEQ
ncbi:MAG TPA: nicotinate-nucleotide adenylyltransferase [Candidatus Kapabacteria bacterium]|nr:nicotinate-nucleotide adenylyltransferase [Candidatus Kapabacteria bacterium]